ncbi:MAG: hypothetical protein ACLR6S_15145 [Lacrimispora saccharolytica]
MRIRKPKMFIRGMLFILLGVAIAVVRFVVFSHNVHGLLKPILAIGACLFVGIIHAVLAFQNDNEEDALKEEN